MQRVVVVCGAGASSTFLVLRLRALAVARDLDVQFTAATLDAVTASLAESAPVPDPPSSNQPMPDPPLSGLLLPDLQLPDLLIVGAHLVGAFPAIERSARVRGIRAVLAPVIDPADDAAVLDLLSTARIDERLSL